MRLRDVARLAKLPNLIVTPDVQVHVSSYSSDQLWPYETGVSKAWSGFDAPSPGSVPAIAIVDSGVEARRQDFGNRIVANVKFSTLPNDSAGDGRGHGTFVAGIAAGGADHYTGATPQAPIVSLDVMDDNGVARTSDVIAAAQWILANKDKYNIRVANFSLHSATKSHFFQDPLDQAVEKLWFNNVVVVAAAGNYGFPDKPSGVLYAPGNDPFVITVGAVDIGGTKNIKDDVNAPWSAYGRTPDGFMKPELAAPGRYMVGPVPEGSTLAVERADKVVTPGYIQLSGTSFAAPVISGAAAQILAKHPEFTPDQVKGALMASTKDVDGAAPDSVGVGELQMSRAAMFLRPPNPNRALEQWVKKNTLTGDTSFDAVSWLDVAKANVSWDSVSWDSVSWADAAWNVVSWADVSWADVSWADVSLGGRLLGRCLLGGHLVRGCRRGRHDGRPDRLRADSGTGGRDHGRPGDRSRPERSAPGDRGRCRGRRGGSGHRSNRGGRTRTEPARRRTGHYALEARAGSNPGPHSFGGYSGRTEKGGCDPRPRGVASGSGEPAGVLHHGNGFVFLRRRATRGD